MYQSASKSSLMPNWMACSIHWTARPLDPKNTGQQTAEIDLNTFHRAISSMKELENFLKNNSSQWKLRNWTCKVLLTTPLYWIHPDHTTAITSYTGSSVVEKYLLFLNVDSTNLCQLFHTELRISANVSNFFKFQDFKNSRVSQKFFKDSLTAFLKAA